MSTDNKEKSTRFNWIQNRISRKVAAALFIAILLVFSTTGFFIHTFTKSMLLDNVEENLATKSDATAEQVNNMFKEKATIVRQMVTNQEIAKYLDTADSRDEALDNDYYDGVSEALDQIVATDESIAMAWVASDRSNFLIGSNSVLSDPAFDIESRPWYEQVVTEEDVYFTEPYMDEVFGEIILSAMTPIKENGTVVGIAAIDIFLDELPNLMQAFNIGETGYSFLITNDGTILYHPNESYILEEQIQSLDGDIAEIGNQMLAGENGLKLAQVDNRSEYIGYAPVPTTDWAIGTALPEKEALAGMNNFTFIMILFFSIACLMLLVIVVILLTRMLRDIPRITEVMNELGLGNLNVVNIQTNSKDEIGQLVTSTNLMQENMRDVVGKISSMAATVSNKSEELTQSANDVKAGSEQVATTMQDLAHGSESEANATTDLSSLMSSFSEEAEEAHHNSRQAYDSSNTVLEHTNEGSKLMERSTAQMEKIDQIIYESVQKVNNLDAHSQKISDLVSVIKDIADQTNLLALNASIEAARAGESGRGFAVVADEVGKLANQVASSVTGITEMVQSIQHESGQVTESLRMGYQEVEQGTEQMETTRNTFEQISNSVTQMVDGIRTISENLSVISTNSEKMNTSIQEIAAISEESAAGIEETSASSQQISSSMQEVVASSDELAGMAEELNELVKQFRL